MKSLALASSQDSAWMRAGSDVGHSRMKVWPGAGKAAGGLIPGGHYGVLRGGIEEKYRAQVHGSGVHEPVSVLFWSGERGFVRENYSSGELLQAQTGQDT